MVMTLPKQEGKKIVTIGLWQCHCRNRGENFCGNGGNVIAENRRKKNLFMLVCGNAIAEIGGKKIVAIVAMPLPKIWEEKKNSGC